jgi:hypothetical protein
VAAVGGWARSGVKRADLHLLPHEVRLAGGHEKVQIGVVLSLREQSGQAGRADACADLLVRKAMVCGTRRPLSAEEHDSQPSIVWPKHKPFP